MNTNLIIFYYILFVTTRDFDKLNRIWLRQHLLETSLLVEGKRQLPGAFFKHYIGQTISVIFSYVDLTFHFSNFLTIQDEPYLYAEIQALNATNPTRYYTNDVLHFSWTVKHAENGSYEDAKNVRILFYFSSSLDYQNNGATSGLTTEGGYASSISNERTLLTYTYSGNGGTFAKGE